MKWIFIGLILNKLGMLHGWTLFWFIVCILLDVSVSVVTDNAK